MREIIYVHLPTFHTKMQLAVEPSLAGRPLAIEEKGFIKAVSEEALAVGIFPGSRTSAARHCAEVEIRSYDPELSRHGAAQVWDLAAQFSPLVEPDSLDGIFLDITGCGNSSALCARIAADLWDHFELVSNIGRGQNKFIAKIAAWEADWHQRQTGTFSYCRVIRPGSEPTFLAGLPISYLWPLEAKTTRHLVSLGLYTIDDVAKVSETELAKEFGPEGKVISALCRGEDTAQVMALYPPPRIAFREALVEGCQDKNLLAPLVQTISEKVARALLRSGRETRRLVLTLEGEDGDHVYAKWLVSPTCSFASITRNALDLLGQSAIATPVSGLTLQAEEMQLAVGKQLGIFLELAQVEREQTLDGILSSIKDRFGLESVDLGRAYEPPRRELLLSRYFS